VPTSPSEIGNRKSEIRLGVLLSGGGRTLQNLIDEITAGRLNARIVQVISTRAEAGGLQRARAAGITTQVIDPRVTTGEAFHAAITTALSAARVDLVCMAGLLWFWRIPPQFEGRVLNIHPALLPAFGGPGMYGHHVHAAVLAAGCTQTGCTVHLADNQYDHGPIVVQRRVPVMPGDTPETLAQRVFEQEKLAYPEAIRLFAAGRLPHTIV
jgi:formyltetrahydrofolate-dependent phosphoribosylglycinamide formyltransferase